MTDSPTTENGPLHTQEATLDDRLIRAAFATPADARAARERLVQSGIAAERVSVVDNAAESAGAQAALQPPDKGLLAQIREKILPDDGNTATIDAAKHNDAILELRPTKEEVERAVQIIQDSNPSRFDADLERWRNMG